MKTFRLMFCMAAFVGAMLAQGPTIATHVVINEFSYDDEGTDDREFVELYNPLATPVDISGWVLQSVDEAYPTDNNADYTVPGAPGSNTTVIPPFGYYTFGSGTVTPAVNQVVGATNLWENDAEAMILRDGANNIVDTVTYEGNKIGQGQWATFPTQFIEGQAIWGNSTFNITPTPQSWSRWNDGYDTDNNGNDFGGMAMTPGTSNHLAIPNALPFFNNFDALAPETAVPGFIDSFVNARAIDPTVTSATNPNVIAASPAGGYAMTVYDPTGGGNTATLNTTPALDFRLECYVYVYATGTARIATDQEYWGIGVRGTVDPTFYNFPIIGQTGQNNASSNTGIAWEYAYVNSQATMRLVDENDGGDDETVLLTIPITAGVNDGWQRLRLEVTGNQIDAVFGGTYGSILDGTRFTGFTSTNGLGMAYLGYREAIATNAFNRAVTVDNLSVIVSPLTTDVDFISVATGGTVNFGLHGGAANAGLAYILLASATGGTPGFVLDASQNFTVVPVVPDAVTDLGLQLANVSPLFGNFISNLDASGEGSAFSALPPLPSGLAGLTIHFGYVVLSTFSPFQLNGFSSNSRAITLTP